MKKLFFIVVFTLAFFVTNVYSEDQKTVTLGDNEYTCPKDISNKTMEHIKQKRDEAVVGALTNIAKNKLDSASANQAEELSKAVDLMITVEVLEKCDENSSE